MHLLKIEWLKNKNYRTFWILTGIFITLFLLWNIGLSKFVNQLNSGPVKISSESYGFPYVWNTMAYVYSWFAFFLCMFVIISMSNEYTFKTQRQHIIDGMHRLDFLHAKAYLILAISAAATIFYTVACLVFGLIMGGSGIFEQAHMIIYVFVFTLNYLSFVALLTLFVKRAGLSIILFLAYLMIEAGLSTYINFKSGTEAGGFFPLQTSDELLPLRSLSGLKAMVNPGAAGASMPSYYFLIGSILFIAGYYFIARRKMLHSDL
jgi:hypothetical protein